MSGRSWTLSPLGSYKLPRSQRVAVEDDRNLLVTFQDGSLGNSEALRGQAALRGQGAQHPSAKRLCGTFACPRSLDAPPTPRGPPPSLVAFGAGSASSRRSVQRRLLHVSNGVWASTRAHLLGGRGSEVPWRTELAPAQCFGPGSQCFFEACHAPASPTCQRWRASCRSLRWRLSCLRCTSA